MFEQSVSAGHGCNVGTLLNPDIGVIDHHRRLAAAEVAHILDEQITSPWIPIVDSEPVDRSHTIDVKDQRRSIIGHDLKADIRVDSVQIVATSSVAVVGSSACCIVDVESGHNSSP